MSNNTCPMIPYVADSSWWPHDTLRPGPVFLLTVNDGLTPLDMAHVTYNMKLHYNVYRPFLKTCCPSTLHMSNITHHMTHDTGHLLTVPDGLLPLHITHVTCHTWYMIHDIGNSLTVPDGLLSLHIASDAEGPAGATHALAQRHWYTALYSTIILLYLVY